MKQNIRSTYFDFPSIKFQAYHFLEIPENGHACVVRAIVKPNRIRSTAIGGAQSRFDPAVVAGRHRSRKLVHRSSDLFILFGHRESGTGSEKAGAALSNNDVLKTDSLLLKLTKKLSI